jgi:hypothetical protein
MSPQTLAETGSNSKMGLIHAVIMKSEYVCYSQV